MNASPKEIEKRKRPLIEIIGCILQAVFSLKMVGGMFLVWIIVNEGGCEKKAERWVPYTGWERVAKGDFQLLAFPILAVIFFATALIALRKAREQPLGYSFFCAVMKLLTVDFLFFAGVSAGFALFTKTKSGPGMALALIGAAGIGFLALVRLSRHLFWWFRPKRSPPLPEISKRRSLRIIGVVDYVTAAILMLGAVIILVSIFESHMSSSDRILLTYTWLMVALFGFALVALGRSIRRGEGWAAIAHTAFAIVVCAINAFLMIAAFDRFLTPDAAVMLWSVFPLLSGVVFYVFFIRARRDINWPIRFARCGDCGKRGIWKANPCPACGNPLRPIIQTPTEAYCIYCRTSFAVRNLVCRRCRKKTPSRELLPR